MHVLNKARLDDHRVIAAAAATAVGTRAGRRQGSGEVSTSGKQCKICNLEVVCV